MSLVKEIDGSGFIDKLSQEYKVKRRNRLTVSESGSVILNEVKDL